MPKDGAEKAVIDALEPLAATHGVDIVDVEVVGATKNPTVRVRIDHADETADTISLDEVSEQTGWISEAIDELDPFPGSFMLGRLGTGRGPRRTCWPDDEQLVGWTGTPPLLPPQRVP